MNGQPELRRLRASLAASENISALESQAANFGGLDCMIYRPAGEGNGAAGEGIGGGTAAPVVEGAGDGAREATGEGNGDGVGDDIGAGKTDAAGEGDGA